MTIPSYKIHGTAAPGNHLCNTVDYFTITTAVNIIPSGIVGDAPQMAFDRLVEIVALNGQPIIAQLPTLSGSVYTFKFMIDHTGAWVDAPTLKAALVAHSPTVFGADSTLTVAIASSY